VSVCPVANSGNAASQTLCADAAVAAKRHRTHSVRLGNVNRQLYETSSDADTTRTSTADECERHISDSSVSVSSSLGLRKSSSSKSTIVIIDGSVPVVELSTNAATAAAAAAAACTAVMPNSSGAQRIRRSKTLADEHAKDGATSRGKRRKSHSADQDVEPSTDSSAAACEYC